MRDYFVPATRRELLSELTRIWPLNAAVFRGMRKNQLYAIFLTYRNRQQQRRTYDPASSGRALQ